MGFELKQFTEQSLGFTTDSWINSSDSLGIPSLDYERTLDWSRNNIDYTEGTNSLAYGIFEDGSDGAIAIVEIVYSQRHGVDVGWLKMLSITLGPTLSPSEVEADASKLTQVIDIYAVATVGTIALTSDHKARVVKLYGRNDSLLTMLIALNERLRVVLADKCHTKMEGRWLVISAH